MIHGLTIETDIGENVRTATIALAGYSARSVIAVINTFFIRKLKGSNHEV